MAALFSFFWAVKMTRRGHEKNISEKKSSRILVLFQLCFFFFLWKSPSSSVSHLTSSLIHHHCRRCSRFVAPSRRDVRACAVTHFHNKTPHRSESAKQLEMTSETMLSVHHWSGGFFWRLCWFKWHFLLYRIALVFLRNYEKASLSSSIAFMLSRRHLRALAGRISSNFFVLFFRWKWSPASWVMLHCALTQSSFVCLIRIFSLRYRENKLCICSVIKLVRFTGRRWWGRKSTFVRLQLTSTAFSLHSVLCGCSLFEMFYNIETNICSCHRWNMVHEPTTTVLRLTVKKWMVYDEFLMNKQQISLVSMFAHHHRTYMHPTMLMPTRKLYLILRLILRSHPLSSPDLSVGSFKWWSSLNSVRFNKELSFIKYKSQHIIHIEHRRCVGNQLRCWLNHSFWRSAAMWK